jgi:tocopherol O-methyltransferase
MPAYNEKPKIIEHYDLASPYYRKLWGEHLHHGYWETGAETNEEAQIALTAHLAEAAQLSNGAVILDVGCGFGGSSIYLANKHQATVTGITISPVQAAMAQEAAKHTKATARFLVMDADDITLRDKFDVVWSIEAISHFTKKPRFFIRAAEMLKPGGTLALIDWFKQEHLPAARHRAYITPIERGMLVELKTIGDYAEMIQAAGLEITHTSDLSNRCSKTWEVSANLIKNRALWRLASEQGVEFIRFLRSFGAMRKGFASGCFVYGMLVARSDSFRKLNDSKQNSQRHFY